MALSPADARAREFAGLGRDAWFNAASFGPLPQRARTAMREHVERKQHIGRLEAGDFLEPVRLARQALANLIAAAPAEIALQPNTSAGINLAAAHVRRAWREGGDSRPRVLLSDGEFPANVYPWLALRRDGLRVELLPLDRRGWPREADLAEQVARGDVAALALSAVQFHTGYRADLAALGAICRAHGTLFVVDAIQAVGVLPLNARTAAVDVLACGGQKWLCGPFGSGFVYVRRALQDRLLPPLPGWLAYTASDDIARVLDYGETLQPDARRYEVGSPALHDQLGLGRSAELLAEIGIDTIWAHVREVQRPLVEWLEDHDDVAASPLQGSARSAILSLRLPAPLPVLRALRAAGIHAAVREGLLRFAPHVYNTSEEMERAVEVLRESV